MSIKAKFRCIIFIVLLFIFFLIFYFCFHSNDDESFSNTLYNDLINNNSLQSDLLNPAELTNEILEKVSTDYKNELFVVKIHYQLKSLDYGTVFLYFKNNDSDLYEVKVNVNSKKIESFNEYYDSFLNNKSEIINNLNENIRMDFENKQSKLDSDDKSVNVIITSSEIIINTDPDD